MISNVQPRSIRPPIAFLHPTGSWLQTELAASAAQLGLGVQPELAIDAPQVAFNGPLAQEELSGYLDGCLATGCEHCHLSLALTEGVHAEAGSSAWSALSSSEEDLDGVGDGVDVSEPGTVVRSRELDVGCVGQMLG